MRRLVILVIAVGVLLALPLVASAGRGGLSPAQLGSQGWTCFNVPGLGVHCAPPGQAIPPTQPELQLLYFFNTTDPASTVPDFTGTESLIRADVYHGQPCPTEPIPGGGYRLLPNTFGNGVDYYACHRR